MENCEDCMKDQKKAQVLGLIAGLAIGAGLFGAFYYYKVK
jgi:hypothetical protein